jgi:hypothetical protein
VANKTLRQALPSIRIALENAKTLGMPVSLSPDHLEELLRGYALLDDVDRRLANYIDREEIRLEAAAEKKARETLPEGPPEY